MNNIRTYRTSRLQGTKGVAMIEVLMGMLLIALWLMSSAGLQASTLKFQKSAGARMSAMLLARELSERMEANKVGAQGGAYIFTYQSGVTPTTDSDCSNVACTPTQLAAYDLKQWQASLVQSLALQSATVKMVVASGVATYTITVGWDESRGRQQYEATSGKTEPMMYIATKVIRIG